ncbi:cyd operon YbgE family protein [Sideroxydans lithotrophicus]|uniref:Cyd operon protein YbgE n=1 Tax=Sideroxydans lithotrophicus (strain ES-1) TaxID=580332 RepID=D5CR00_SIDLE|nr:cyd operon YbgE family protein [Sideroxydans lithotrophicus]ADE11386.1 Cyd operon protein YbgE [Sideroxydans lithotrophicus ES-1]
MTVRQETVPAAHGGIYAALPRMLSLLLALALTGIILTYPRALGHTSHGMLSLTMLGICAGFIHGVGFIPETRLWRLLFGPWVAWALMGLGLWLLLNS